MACKLALFLLTLPLAVVPGCASRTDMEAAGAARPLSLAAQSPQVEAESATDSVGSAKKRDVTDMALGELPAGKSDVSTAQRDGSGAYGVSILGSYGESVVSRVRPNWPLPAPAKNYTATVNLKITPDGTVQRASIVRSSGNAYFDSSIIQAVMASQLEPPPPGISKMDITFSTANLHP